MVNIVYRRTTQ